MDYIEKPEKLYHGSSKRISGTLKPVLEHGTLDHMHTKPAVFATARLDVAALFMFPIETLHSIGFEQGVAYICIWGTAEYFKPKDIGGFMYIFSPENFEKIGKDYEWQSFEEVMPVEVKEFSSVIDGMMECGVQVYFINDDIIFDRIVEQKNNRLPILKELVSENKKQGKNIKDLTDSVGLI